MSLHPSSSNKIKSLGRTIEITNKLLNEINSRSVLPSDDFQIAVPDINFQRFLSENMGMFVSNGYVSYKEVKTVKELNCHMLKISSIEGIQYFTALTTLNCSWNNLTCINLSKNTFLSNLDCSDNQLSSLDLSQNSELTFLNCMNNHLTKLDVHTLINLSILNCSENRLKYLDTSQNIALSELKCWATGISEIDLSKNIALTSLDCTKNHLTSLDVQNNIALTDLAFGFNNIADIDLSKNIALTALACYSNSFSTLDISHNTLLSSLNCRNNNLSRLDLSKHLYLQKVELSGNRDGWGRNLEKRPEDFWISLDQNWQHFLYKQISSEPNYDSYMMIASYTYEDYLYGPSLKSLEEQNKLAYDNAVITWLNSISENEIIKILNLEQLHQGYNECWSFEDFNPLSKLTNLKEIEIQGSQNNDFSPLSNLLQLRILDLSFSDIVDISFLSIIPQLNKVILAGNKITDISPLISLISENTTLYANLMENLISDISPLFKLPKDTLSYLELGDNPISEKDISALRAHFTNDIISF